MLHYMDDLDSKMEAMRAQFEREAELDSAWTSYNPSLGRPLLNSKKFLEPKPPEPPAQAAAAGTEPAEPFAPAHQHSNGKGESTAVEAQMELTPGAETQGQHSSMEALHQKFAAHKVTPVEPKPH